MFDYTIGVCRSPIMKSSPTSFNESTRNANPALQKRESKMQNERKTFLNIELIEWANDYFNDNKGILLFFNIDSPFKLIERIEKILATAKLQDKNLHKLIPTVQP